MGTGCISTQPPNYQIEVTIMEASKHCTRCKIEKPLNDFHKLSASKDGLKYWCKTCIKTYAQTPRGKKHQATRARKYHQSDKGRVRGREYKKLYQTREYVRFRNKARNDLHTAIRTGKITRPNSCSLCAVECMPEGHHTDYTKPLEVEWLCSTCHIKAHK